MIYIKLEEVEYEFSEEKDHWLRLNRNIGFEDIIARIHERGCSIR